MTKPPEPSATPTTVERARELVKLHCDANTWWDSHRDDAIAAIASALTAARQEGELAMRERAVKWCEDHKHAHGEYTAAAIRALQPGKDER